MVLNAWRSPHLTYRALEPSDDTFIFRLHSDSEGRLNNNASIASPPSHQAARKFCEEAKTRLISVIICIPASADGSDVASEPEPIGRIVLMWDGVEMLQHRTAKLGIHILGQYQGKGYGTEAIEWILRWAFRMAGLHRVSLGCFAWNPRAIALYERIGFVHEGRSRENLWFDGAFHDEVQMSMLEREWRPRYGGGGGALSQSAAGGDEESSSIDMRN